MSLERRRIHKPEEQLWSQVVQAVGTLEVAHLTGVARISQANELLDSLPLSQSMDLDGPSQDNPKSIYRKLYSSITEVKAHGEDELKAIKEALEPVTVLIALKRSPDNAMSQEKRAKRSGIATPTSQSRTPGATPPPPSITVPLPPMRSAAQQSAGFSREPKARREALADQLPLKPGRKVAFRPVSKKGVVGPDGKKEDGEEWILASVRRCINQDKNRYEVQDADPTEDGQPGPCYNTTLRNLIPLPDPTSPLGDPTHPASYETFQLGATVMAQYPDTTTFYRAEVVQGPLAAAQQKGGQQKTFPFYRLKFEDDDGQILPVMTHLVVAWPGDG